MARRFNTPPVEVQMASQPDQSLPLRLRDKLLIAGSTFYALLAWGVLLWVVLP